jgi:NAD(P)-dependent dehydrogenase (short-subunit alcohol dehydrogenase family)
MLEEVQNNKRSKVLITGASRGIGFSIASLFAEKGYSVIAPTHSELDLSNVLSIKEYISMHSNDIDILINNAGINPLKGIMEITYEDYMKIFQTNLFSCLELIKWCVPYWQKRQFGHVINISSIWGGVSKPRRLLYGATKSALNNITKNLALELGEYNILINAIAPGFINTELTRLNNTFEEIEKIKDQIPLKRLAEPDEVARLVFFLGTQNSFITGQTIYIDGGYTCQ